MPTWNEIDQELEYQIRSNGVLANVACDKMRQSHIEALSTYRERPVITYYSGFLQKSMPDGRSHPQCSINDFDMNGFMAVSHNLERSVGLDLILHTPGGGTEATRAIVEYLYKMFSRDITVIVPQMAMSAGTMIACAARQIIMGKHSCLGPTDPQISGLPALGVLYEIDQALKEIKADPHKQLVWQEVFRKYPPGFIANCERSRDGTEKMVREWLEANMLSTKPDPRAEATILVSELMNFKETTEHGHHFLPDKCIEIGLNVEMLEKDQRFQELVLSVHHAYVASFARLKSLKFIENSQKASWNISG